MDYEEKVRLIVEQVLAELAKERKKQAGPAGDGLLGEIAAGSAEPPGDLAGIESPKYLQVPNPVNGNLYEDMMTATPARIGVWRSGTRPLTDTLLRFRADHALAKDAVLGEVAEDLIAKLQLVPLKTLCRDKDEYLTRPDLGRRLEEESLAVLRKECAKSPQVQIIVVDGLSSRAVEANIPDLLPAFLQGLSSMGIKANPPVFVRYGRVAIMDVIGEEIKPEVAVIFIGERPGLGTAESMSAYLGYHPRVGMVESERMVLSNIHRGGTPPAEAGAYLATLVKKILEAKASGVHLQH